jgi:DNA-binding IclR family transcriptional regulator
MSISGHEDHEPSDDRLRPRATELRGEEGAEGGTGVRTAIATDANAEAGIQAPTATGPGTEAGADTLATGDPAAAGTIRAVERAIAVLCAFSRETPWLGVTELAEKLDLTKSSVHRVLQVLVAHGLVAQDPVRRNYSLGYRILALAQAVPGEADLRHICQPHMRTLLVATQETISLYAAAGDVRVCLEELESPQMLRMSAGVGRCFPLDRGSASYALLIDGPDAGEAWHRLTAVLPPERVVELLERIRAVRAAGYARSGGETVAGAASIAAPIRSPDGHVVAALSVGGPATRFTEEAVARHRGALLDTIARIERDFAATWAPSSSSSPSGAPGRAKGGAEGRR